MVEITRYYFVALVINGVSTTKTKISSEKKIVDHALLDRRPIRIQSKSDKSELARKDNVRLRYLYRNIIQIEREKGLITKKLYL